MRLEISHMTEYIYSGEVFFEPHYFRFKPKPDSRLELKAFNIEIEPQPSGTAEQIDIENNHLLLGWFEGTHQELRITSAATVEIKETNPFQFLIHPAEYSSIPFRYQKKDLQLLRPSLHSIRNPGSLKDFTNNIVRASKNQSVDFLTRLTREIHNEFTLKSRIAGKPHRPEYTLNRKEGSCRDLAWMQIHMLRQVGIASRFVSGYYFVNVEDPDFELHAWVEAYLPGAGWIGLDPSHGIFTDGNHIPVASSAFYQNTMPVNGTVRGSAGSELKNTIRISQIMHP